ncbi:hypothetical protein JCM3263A_16850 [Thermobifida fusca]
MPISRAIARSETPPGPCALSRLRAIVLISASVAARIRIRRDMGTDAAPVSHLAGKVVSLGTESPSRWDLWLVERSLYSKRRTLWLTVFANVTAIYHK